ncbi:MAG: hypothetical protein ACJ74Z_10905 [Bryobacteraceae bacterium]
MTQFAANHEHVIANSLFCAGLTWPAYLYLTISALWILWHRARTLTRPGLAAPAYLVADDVQQC